jgi:hypothetical protein
VPLPTGNPRARAVPGCGEQRIVPPSGGALNALSMHACTRSNPSR